MIEKIRESVDAVGSALVLLLNWPSVVVNFVDADALGVSVGTSLVFVTGCCSGALMSVFLIIGDLDLLCGSGLFCTASCCCCRLMTIGDLDLDLLTLVKYE